MQVPVCTIWHPCHSHDRHWSTVFKWKVASVCQFDHCTSSPKLKRLYRQPKMYCEKHLMTEGPISCLTWPPKHTHEWPSHSAYHKKTAPTQDYLTLYGPSRLVAATTETLFWPALEKSLNKEINGEDTSTFENTTQVIPIEYIDWTRIQPDWYCAIDGNLFTSYSSAHLLVLAETPQVFIVRAWDVLNNYV